MTFDNLKTGSHLGNRAVVVAVRAGLVILFAMFAGMRAEEAFAQRSLASILLPTDSSASKKSSKPKPSANEFVRNQLEYERVLAARVEKRFEVKKIFRERGIAYPAAEIFMRAFKREQELEVWVRPQGEQKFVLLKTYEICALGEKPGPKRKQGDLQTPEGFYYIDDFNPRSGYHLSLHVNYPNESDRILGDGKPLGGDIFMHGGCKTAGCLALTDDGIKEVYVMAMESRDNGQQRIPVHIFPARLGDENLKQLVRVFEKDAPRLITFWANLKTGYDVFETTRTLPAVSVNKRGRYVFTGLEPAAPRVP